MCGLYGFSGNEKADLNKIKILGLYNASRGEDSAGIYLGGFPIIKKTGSVKYLFSDIDISNYMSNKSNTIVAHTRKASVGGISLNNAHPFNYQVNKVDTFTFAHNGTIQNWQTYLNDFVKTKDFTVDSNALGLAIANKKHHVLENYKGAVTYLLSEVTKKEDYLEVFKGATIDSTTKTYSADRPMFALKTKEGVYFSSILDSLKAISEEKDTFIEIEENKVYVFEKGKIKKSFPIDRKVVSYSNYNYGSNYSKSTYSKNNYSPAKTTSSSSKANKAFFEKKPVNIWLEKLNYSPNVFQGRVYFEQGRYKRNGHLLDSRKNKNNPYYIDVKDGSIVQNKEATTDPFFFYRGCIIKVKTIKEYVEAVKILDAKFEAVKISNFSYNVYDSAKAISFYVEHPFQFLIEELGEEQKRIPRQTIFLNGTGAYNRVYNAVRFARKIQLFIDNYGGTVRVISVENYKSFEEDCQKWSDLIMSCTKVELASLLDSKLDKIVDNLDIENDTLVSEYLTNFQFKNESLVEAYLEDDLEPTFDKLDSLIDLYSFFEDILNELDDVYLPKLPSNNYLKNVMLSLDDAITSMSLEFDIDNTYENE